jgi:hypothetical protein
MCPIPNAISCIKRPATLLPMSLRFVISNSLEINNLFNNFLLFPVFTHFFTKLFFHNFVTFFDCPRYSRCVQFSVICIIQKLSNYDKIYYNSIIRYRWNFNLYIRARGIVVDWGIMLQASRSRVRDQLRSLDFSIGLIRPAALWSWVRLSL